MKRSVFVMGLLAVLMSCSGAGAEVRLAKIFSDNMVLQRNKPIRVWGWADPGENVTVSLSGREASVKADSKGRWLAELPAMKEGENLELTVAAARTNVLKNIIIGDVWICSGQSNMEWTFGGCNSPEDVRSADFPKIRQVKIACVKAETEQEELPAGGWQVCSPKTASGFTAVGLYFAREIHQKTGVPIGLISDNWGGTAIEPWTAPEGMAMTPALAPEVAKKAKVIEDYRAALPKTLDELDRWTAATREALRKGSGITPPPAMPASPASGGWSSIYNAMVHPIIRFPIKGVLWYQGETNGGEGDSYYHKMHALIGGWRKLWGQGDFPFYFVQLANFQQPTEDPAGGNGWARLRCAQTKSLTITNTGMAVAIDVGEGGDIHPKNKFDVGIRLARWALARDYDKKDMVPSGPLFREIKIEGDKARISFDYADSGLMAGIKKGRDPVVEDKDGKLRRFAVAGADKVWSWANAVIDGSTVLVSSTNVPAPVAVRYGFSCNPQGVNLYNKEGLPASPFRTDDW